MIDQITGQVAKLDKDAVVVVVGGVGLRVRVPKTVLDSVHGAGGSILLYTHLIVREDDLSLYGFATEEERSLFEILIGVSGVGPRTAVAVLSTLSVDHLRMAVRRDEPEILTRVPGIGKKTAEKIIFELKGKMGRDLDAVSELASISDTDAEVIAALTALGYSIVEAQSAVQSIPRDASKEVETRILYALQYFSG